MHSSPLRELVAKCRSWEQFRRKLAKRSDKEKGDLFEHLVRAYLQLDPEYATKLRKVWLLEDVPSALRKKLHLPASDQGIDLIAETNTGEYWAIQCKYRENTERALTWAGDLSTFAGLAFGLCKNISFGLVCSTTERITSVLKHRERIGFCALDVWQGLDKEFFDRLRKLLGHKPTKLVPLKPRPHQKKAIADARKYFVGKKKKRGKLISPCGSGKSLTAYWIARDLKAKKIVVAVPSLALIRQTLKVWLRESLAHGDKVDWICVCSDESAGRVEQDDVAVLRQDLGVPCLTDPKEIASRLKQNKPGLTIVFATYQSGEALGKAARRAKFTFDLGIMDEAHKTVGDGDKLFSHLLHDKNLPIRRRIFMTATERRYRGKGDKILSMDNATIYGDTFHLLSFKRALETKPAILSDYRIVTILVSREEVADLIRKNVFVKPDRGRWNKEIEAEMLASLVALRKAIRKYPIKHAVSFHSSIQRAEIFKDHNEAYNQAFKKDGTIETFHVSGKTPTGTRARIVNEFASTDRGLITNARCLTEGVDVPDIDCVMFADPRRSAVDIVQAVGRALRPAKGKNMGYVIVPILHDAKAKPDDIFDSEQFQEILTTLRALAANDERIIEYFRAVSQGKRSRKGGSVFFDIDEKLVQRINLNSFAREIDLRCWSRLARLSWRPFEEAKQVVWELGLRSVHEWYQLTQGALSEKGALPADIPKFPNQVYAGAGWISYGDWLGTGRIANIKRAFMPFEEARKRSRKLRLKNAKEWRAWCRGELRSKGVRPAEIPSAPEVAYRDHGWKGYGDWLGTGIEATHQRTFLPFKEARTYVRKLGFKNSDDWVTYCRGNNPRIGKKPPNIPSLPHKTYADKGWVGMGDWLGTGFVATRLRKYRSFRRARAFVRRLKLSSSDDWRKFCAGKLKSKGRLPADIPTNPVLTYRKKGWAGMGDWLGTGYLAPRSRSFRAFEEAREFVRSLGLRNTAEWRAFCKGQLRKGQRLPSDIPTAAWRIYKDKGWAGMGDWLGTGNVAKSRRKFRSFREARSFARSLRLKSSTEWVCFCGGKTKQLGTLPADIPSNPNQTYANQGWIGYADWLGIGRRYGDKHTYRAFSKARDFARKLRLSSQHEWADFCRNGRGRTKRPRDIPSNPNLVYKNSGWMGYGDWLGTGNVAPRLKRHRAFSEARRFAQSLRLQSRKQWLLYTQGKTNHRVGLPCDIPANPAGTYKLRGWKGYGDWLGTKTIAPQHRTFMPFRQARKTARGLGLKNREEWKNFARSSRRPSNLPAAPHQVYQGRGWQGYGDWLGTGNIAGFLKKFRNFAAARAYARNLRVETKEKWIALGKQSRLPFDIPSDPYGVYKRKGWISWPDWLGTDRRRKARRRR